MGRRRLDDPPPQGLRAARWRTARCRVTLYGASLARRPTAARRSVVGRRWSPAAVSVDAGQRGTEQHCMGRCRDDDPPPRGGVWRAGDGRRPQCRDDDPPPHGCTPWRGAATWACRRPSRGAGQCALGRSPGHLWPQMGAIGADLLHNDEVLGDAGHARTISPSRKDYSFGPHEPHGTKRVDLKGVSG